MYTTLSHFPTALVNATYEQYVHDNILAPLGMDDTRYFYADAVKTGRLADSFLREGANLTEDPFAQGTIRVFPYWDQSTKGHGMALHAFFACWQMLNIPSSSHFRRWRSHLQRARHGIAPFPFRLKKYSLITFRRRYGFRRFWRRERTAPTKP
jgi:CubicO group peptidase (beta-lactamase class C family)